MRFWVGCDHPERPPDEFTIWCLSPCRACALKLEVKLNGLDPTNAADVPMIVAAHTALDRVAPGRPLS